MNNEDFFPDDFPTNDPEEKLRMENELLRLKLQAQFGAISGGDENAPPEMINEFLKNVMAFETSFSEGKKISVYDKIGNPDFVYSAQLDDKFISQALHQIIDILNQHHINISFIAEYSDRIKYEFITEELFEHETDDIDVPGFTTNFIYEEFHPNHKLEIEEKTEEFLNHWLQKSFDQNSWELGNTFVLPDRRLLKKDELLKKMNLLFNSFREFINSKFFIADINFEIYEDGTGMGHSEGGVKYTGILESGETIQFEGPFKLYFSKEYDAWSIIYFVFPGFEW